MLFRSGSNYQPAASVTATACATAATWTPNCAIIPTAATPTGGSAIAEALCTAAGTLGGSSLAQTCAFPGYAAVVGRKNGERAYRDAPVANSRIADTNGGDLIDHVGPMGQRSRHELRAGVDARA